MALGLTAGLFALLPTAPAVATGGGGGGGGTASFVCASDTVYSIDQGSHAISKITPSTGAASSNGSFDAGSGDAVNALALPGGGGRYAYAFNRSDNQVLRFDAATGDTDSYHQPSNDNASSVIAGAINPATGIYYYAAGGDPWRLYAFNTGTNTSIGRVGTISDLSVNGDMAFDAVGNLYVVSNASNTAAGTLARVNGPLPTTAGSTTLAATKLATLPGNSGQYASMAFDGSGDLVIGTGSGKVLRVNPSSGVLISTKDTNRQLSDMASCSSPSTANANVNLPSGRHGSGDQFTVTITGNGVSSGNTGTTTGSDSGLQGNPAEVAGPVVVVPGKTYTITQTAAGGTDLNDYTTTWKCVSGVSGTTIASGAGNSGTFTVPASAGSTITCTFTDLPRLPAIELDKTAGALVDTDGNGPDAGDTVTYGFKVTNTGNIVLDPVTVADPKLGAITCPSGPLAVGASITCTPKTYAVSQSEVDAGRVDNTATATGIGSNGVRVTDTDSVTVPVTPRPAIELDKTAGPVVDADDNGPDAGDTITYGFTVTNTGNVTLDPVTLVDPMLADPMLGGAIACGTGALAPGASRTCTSQTYELTQADVNAGKVANTATATGTPPSGPVVTDTDSTTTTLAGAPEIALDKTASTIVDGDGNGPDAGDTITFGFEVTNTGTVTLDPVTLVDPMLADPMLGGAIACGTGALAPGASRTCTSQTYELTQADVNAGKVDNTATATGTPPSGPSVTDTDSTTTPVTGTPAITLDKIAGAIVDGDGNGPDRGDTIDYTFVVTNTGTVTLSTVGVSDPKAGPVSCPVTTLAPGASTTCTAAAYALTQADVDAGKVDNTATATGTPPYGPKVTDRDSTHTPVPPHAALELLKTAGAVNDVNGNGLDDGDTVTYHFTVTNTGTVTLSLIGVTDPKVGPVTCPATSLAPGESLECEPRTYSLTQDDIDHGSVDNTATATGTTPSGETVEDDDSRTVPLPATGAIQLVKTASAVHDLDGNGPDEGDTIEYSFRVTNTGNVRLDPVTVSDPKVGPVTCPSGALDPGESFDCTPVTYTITAADQGLGRVDNTATATGTAPSGGTVQDTDSTTTPVQPTVTNVKVTKTVDDAAPREGDVVTYTLAVTNTGAAAARDVVVVDVLPAGVTLVSADAPCTTSGVTVRCELGTVPAGQTRSVDVRVKVAPLPTSGADHQHLFDVQKTEVQVDVEPGAQATGTVTCPSGYVVTDGSGRVDHVDQGTGTLADVAMTENHAVGDDGWTARFLSEATGRAQAKVFAVCVARDSEVVSGHRHSLVIDGQQSETRSLPTGRTTIAMGCVSGQVPIQPGYALDDAAPVVTTYPDGEHGWTFAVDNPGGASAGTFTLRCLDVLVGSAHGHQHRLALDEVRQTATVQPGEVAEVTLSCAADAKGIVAGYDVDPGLVVLGNDPRPIVRVFKLYNPTAEPLDARLYLLCLANRTERGADADGTVVNTATVSTSTTETSTTDNASSVTFQVDTSPASTPPAPSTPAGPSGPSVPPTVIPGLTPVVPRALVARAAVTATVGCAGTTACTGRATLVAAKRVKVRGTVVRKGAVLAKASYSVEAGSQTKLRLAKTRLGKVALKGAKVRRAALRVGGESFTVRLHR
ncbi:DUF11 domain-containing protein [Nocardioides sp. LMS-CY]|uniref:DUF7507 domain-containing protein n=1 Tax=Nocardioides sp. (strain LMS-CY) TaxID=2840457 RepID=UPI001BFFECE3|nr:DUF11 domain-containing protein [Nocardioides sp. LMS-CY]QWF22006.1 DUF11 domain-containing protein [Nocardioides sp. LMS-CY]